MKGVLKSVAIAALALVIGILGTLLVLSAVRPSNSSSPSPSIVFERIVQQNELVSVTQDYSITDKVSNTSKFMDQWDIPFTTNSFWYRYVGTLQAGVNLKNADFAEQDFLLSKKISITLDQPYIISNTPDMEVSGVLEENNNFFNPISIQAADDFQRQCIEQSEAKAIEGGLLEEAKSYAETDIRALFNAALGDEYEVEVIWRTE